MSHPAPDIVPIGDVTIADATAAIGTVFGPRSVDWFRWKHLENPAGPSPGWAAVDRHGVVGIRLLLRWNLLIAGEKRRALRPVDTVTVPRAQRRGIFQALLDTALEHVNEHENAALIFNTPNENSRNGYAKNGWKVLDPVGHGFRLTVPGPSLGEPVDISALVFPTDDGASISTDRTNAYLDWRYDPRSGHRYRAATAADDDDTPSGIVYRISNRRKSRTLMLCECFGPPRRVSRLIASTARRERALVTIGAVGPGTPSPTPLSRHLLRGSTVLAVLPRRDMTPDPLVLDSWRLTLGDLEDVI